MKKKQIKNITNRLLEGSDNMCNSESEKRTYYQGARKLVHALFMNRLINNDDWELMNAPINKEIDKILDAL